MTRSDAVIFILLAVGIWGFAAGLARVARRAIARRSDLRHLQAAARQRARARTIGAPRG